MTFMIGVVKVVKMIKWYCDEKNGGVVGIVFSNAERCGGQFNTVQHSCRCLILYDTTQPRNNEFHRVG